MLWKALSCVVKLMFFWQSCYDSRWIICDHFLGQTWACLEDFVLLLWALQLAKFIHVCWSGWSYFYMYTMSSDYVDFGHNLRRHLMTFWSSTVDGVSLDVSKTHCSDLKDIRNYLSPYVRVYLLRLQRVGLKLLVRAGD